MQSLSLHFPFSPSLQMVCCLLAMALWRKLQSIPCILYAKIIDIKFFYPYWSNNSKQHHNYKTQSILTSDQYNTASPNKALITQCTKNRIKFQLIKKFQFLSDLSIFFTPNKQGRTWHFEGSSRIFKIGTLKL